MIYDVDNNPLPSYLMNLDAGSVYQFTIRVNCRAGVYLRSESVSDLLVEARKEGDTSWIAIEATPIDLSSDAGTRQNYEFKLTAASVTSEVTNSFKIYCE